MSIKCRTTWSRSALPIDATPPRLRFGISATPFTCSSPKYVMAREANFDVKISSSFKIPTMQLSKFAWKAGKSGLLCFSNTTSPAMRCDLMPSRRASSALRTSSISAWSSTGMAMFSIAADALSSSCLSRGTSASQMWCSSYSCNSSILRSYQSVRSLIPLRSSSKSSPNKDGRNRDHRRLWVEMKNSAFSSERLGLHMAFLSHTVKCSPSSSSASE